MIMSRKWTVGAKMSKKLGFYGLVIVTSLCIFFLLFNQRYSNYIENRLQPVISVSKKFVEKNWSEITQRTRFYTEVEMKSQIGRHEEFNAVFSNVNNITYLEIQESIDQQRRFIQNDMKGYKYPNGLFGINVSSLNDLILEKGGRPMRSIILASWRSGSTFVGDVVNAHPANFYHYEPLLDFGIVQVRGPPLAQVAIANIYALLNCEYHKLKNYLNFGKTHPWVFNHNTHLWRQCTTHRKICWDPTFVSQHCRLFPFQSMKLVRLRLKIAEVLLEDESLGIRMVLLVRDPRGLLQSRKHRDWCPSSDDCSDPARVCADMVADYESAVRLRKKFPHNFKVIRYEDFSLDPFEHTKNLYKFYGLDFHVNVRNFLDTHTKSDLGGVSSTFRNSKAAPFHWRNDLNHNEVKEIQKICSNAMQIWGYTLAFNETHQKNFNPITDYTLAL